MGARHAHLLRYHLTALIYLAVVLSFPCINMKLHKLHYGRALKLWAALIFWSPPPLTMWHIATQARIADLCIFSGCRVFLISIMRLPHWAPAHSFRLRSAACVQTHNTLMPTREHTHTHTLASPSGGVWLKQCSGEFSSGQKRQNGLR